MDRQKYISTLQELWEKGKDLSASLPTEEFARIWQPLLDAWVCFCKSSMGELSNCAGLCAETIVQQGWQSASGKAQAALRAAKVQEGRILAVSAHIDKQAPLGASNRSIPAAALA